jgi:hypothetical protein
VSYISPIWCIRGKALISQEVNPKIARFFELDFKETRVGTRRLVELLPTEYFCSLLQMWCEKNHEHLSEQEIEELWIVIQIVWEEQQSVIDDGLVCMVSL